MSHKDQEGGFVAKHDYRCEFAGVSIGDATARIGVTVSRDIISLERADDLFANHRLIGRIILGHADDAPLQGKLFEGDTAIYAAFDAKGFRVSSGTIGLGLTFSRKDVNVSELANFAKSEGRLQIAEVAEIPDEKEAPEHKPGEFALEDGQTWRDYPMVDIVGEGAVMKALRGAKIETVGDLHDYQKNGQWLTNIKGLGEKKVAELEEAMMHFWADNQEAGEEHEAMIDEVFNQQDGDLGGKEAAVAS